MANIELVLFDLGGVLVELGDELFPSHWLDYRQTFSLTEWFHSPTAQLFETGKISPDRFITALKDTLGLNAKHSDIEDAFTNWIKGLYPGTEELIKDVTRHYETAVLSNTNELHESILLDDLGLRDQIDTLFLSHKIGKAKPNANAFLHVIDQLGRSPREVIFFDDNLANVMTANELGIRAHHVQGPDQVRAYLNITREY